MAETLELPPDAREAGIEGQASEPEHVLREITGPSAFGGDRHRFLDLLRLVTSNEFRAQYATTTLGFLWTIIRPIVFFGVIFLVLRGVLRFGASIPNYGQMLVVSLILFTYFQESTSRGVKCVAAKEGMVRKMRFPRIIIPLSVSISAMMTLVLNYAAVFPLMVIFGLRPDWEWLLFPLLLIPLAALTTGMTMILAVLFIRFKDTAQVWGLIGRILFYASPVLFPIETYEKLPYWVQCIICANPLSPILEQARIWVIDPTAPNGVDQVGWLFGLIIPVVLIVVISIYGYVLFKREAPKVAEAL